MCNMVSVNTYKLPKLNLFKHTDLLDGDLIAARHCVPSFDALNTRDVNTVFLANRFLVVENWFETGFRFYWPLEKF